MTKWITGMLAFSSIWLMNGFDSTLVDAQSRTSRGSLAHVNVERIVMMPFLTGQLEPPDAPIQKPLSAPFTQLAASDPGLPEDAGRVMDRLAGAALKLRFQDRLVPEDRTAAAYQAVLADQALDTPRKRAVKLAEALEANLVMVGTVWRLREKGALADLPENPASVGFALYLVDAASGVRLWRGVFDGTQKALTEDVLGGLKQLGMGLHWLSAAELARYGIASLLRELPLN